MLIHSSTPNTLGPWPKSVEVQLALGNAGDLWIIGTKIHVENAQSRTKDRRTVNLTDDSEKPVGEWNSAEVTCKSDEITVKINGQLVNHATGCSVTKGAICLQSERTEIHFRNIVLTPLQ